MTATAIFTNKGGVGKTMFACNLAHGFSAAGQKTLVIDLDPQCNATELLLGQSVWAGAMGKGTTDVASIMDPVARGDGYIREIVPVRSEGFELDLIPGSVSFALHEDLLAGDWGNAKAADIRGLRTTMVFADVIRRIASEYDQIIVDCGPSLGSINRAALIAVDRFISPVGADIFSRAAMGNMAKWIGNWRRSLERIPAMSGTSKENLEDMLGQPVPVCAGFGGYLESTADRRAVATRTSFTDEIRRGLDRSALDLALAADPRFEGNCGRIGEIPYCGALPYYAQNHNLPYALLTAEHGLVGAQFAHALKAREGYAEMAERLLGDLEPAHEPVP